MPDMSTLPIAIADDASSSPSLDGWSVVLVGCGQMGGAIARGLISSGALEARELVCVDAHLDAQRALAEALGASQGLSAVESRAGQPRAFVIAVKPHYVREVLEGMTFNAHDRVISVAAGVSLGALRRWSGDAGGIARAMPNTPCLVGQGVTGYMASDAHGTKLCAALFGCVGLAIALRQEADFDAVTAVSGSGPAYIFVAIEALADAGVREGLDRATSQAIAIAMIEGAAHLARVEGSHPAQLKDRVASPGGTTIAALTALETAGFRHALQAAVQTAAARSRVMASAAEDA